MGGHELHPARDHARLAVEGFLDELPAEEQGDSAEGCIEAAMARLIELYGHDEALTRAVAVIESGGDFEIDEAH